ncbi:hypothetical protein M9H77_11597 [Catharanthus roseus]|uniref:Uncharacterized protein n=1 Tax=Catharanthus roseus TaxID=4058 RepID=A0ACC0BF45_CATRO|nr:hypothetical protein M9H77_11597 [Catharanthus roseus]
MTMKANTYLIITRYLRSRTSNSQLYITLACERRNAIKSRTKPRIDDEEEEVPIKRRGPYETKKCDCPFKLKGEQIITSENWQLFVHDGRHNHKIGVYSHGHAQATRLAEEQLTQTENLGKVMCHHCTKNIQCTYEDEKNRMHERNTAEEVFCLSAQHDYMVFYRNCEDSNVLSDIVVAHPISIEMIRMWHMY